MSRKWANIRNQWILMGRARGIHVVYPSVMGRKTVRVSLLSQLENDTRTQGHPHEISLRLVE